MPLFNPEFYHESLSIEDRYFMLRGALKLLCGQVALKTNNPKLKKQLMSKNTNDIAAIQAVSDFIDSEVKAIGDLTQQLATALANEADPSDTPETVTALKALTDKIATIQAANNPSNPAAASSAASTAAAMTPPPSA